MRFKNRLLLFAAVSLATCLFLIFSANPAQSGVAGCCNCSGESGPFCVDSQDGCPTGTNFTCFEFLEGETCGGGTSCSDSDCDIESECPCEGFSNHGQYVRCVTVVARDCRDDGVISDEEYDQIVTQAAESDCGGKAR